MINLEQIKARLAAATPGPWSEFCESGDWWIEQMDTEGGPSGQWICDANEMTTATMFLIAAAPTDIAVLIAELESARAMIAAGAALLASCKQTSAALEEISTELNELSTRRMHPNGNDTQICSRRHG